MSDGTLSGDIEFEGTPSVEPDVQDAVDQSSAEDARLERYAGEAGDAEFMQYMRDAASSGASPSLIDQLLGKAGSAINATSAWAKANPGLAAMLAGGVGSAMKDKSAKEAANQKRDWELEDKARAKADAKELWDRKNQSIIDTKPASLGLIGSNMLDGHLSYLQNRK